MNTDNNLEIISAYELPEMIRVARRVVLSANSENELVIRVAIEVDKSGRSQQLALFEILMMNYYFFP